MTLPVIQCYIAPATVQRWHNGFPCILSCAHGTDQKGNLSDIYSCLIFSKELFYVTLTSRTQNISKWKEQCIFKMVTLNGRREKEILLITETFFIFTWTKNVFLKLTRKSYIACENDRWEASENLFICMYEGRAGLALAAEPSSTAIWGASRTARMLLLHENGSSVFHHVEDKNREGENLTKL